MTPAETFKACAPADREAPIMALEREARSLTAKALACRDHGADAIAEIAIGQQTAVLAALEVLRELHKEGAK
jgi:hypothetical protein